MSVLTWWIIGAIVAGIVMGVAHSNAKKGIAWGQPVEIVAGIIAIAFGFMAVYENLFGASENVKLADKWESIRGKGAAEWVGTKCAGKKILLVHSYLYENQTDVMYDAVKANLPKDMTVVDYQLPRPKEYSSQDEMDMELMMYDGSVRPNARLRKKLLGVCDEFEKNLKDKGITPDQYDVVVCVGSIDEWMIYPTPVKTLDVFKNKKFIFLYGANEIRAKKSDMIIGYLCDKPLPTPEDYEKQPTGDQATDFNTRFEFKLGGAK